MPAAGAEISVETGARQRVSVTGLTAEELVLAEGQPSALAVHTGEAPGPEQPPVLGDLRVEGRALHFEPRFPFVAGLRYTASLELPGRPRLVRVFEAAEPEGEGPQVTAVFPSADTLPENTLRLYVRFSQPMEARGVAEQVRLFEAGGAEVPLPFVGIEQGLWDAGQTRLTLLFHPGRVKRGVAPGERLGPPLRAGNEYRLVVGAGLRNRLGQPLRAAFERSFRVGPADRDSPRVEELRVTAPPAGREALVAELPEPLDEALLRRLLWVEDERGQRVDGEVEVAGGETLWRFRPARPWQPGAYLLRVHPALEDRAGNRFDRLFDRETAAPDAAPARAERPHPVPFQIERARRRRSAPWAPTPAGNGSRGWAGGLADAGEVDGGLVGGEPEQAVDLGVEEAADGHGAELQPAGGQVQVLPDMARVQPDVAVAAQAVLPGGPLEHRGHDDHEVCRADHLLADRQVGQGVVETSCRDLLQPVEAGVVVVDPVRDALDPLRRDVQLDRVEPARRGGATVEDDLALDRLHASHAVTQEEELAQPGQGQGPQREVPYRAPPFEGGS